MGQHHILHNLTSNLHIDMGKLCHNAIGEGCEFQMPAHAILKFLIAGRECKFNYTTDSLFDSEEFESCEADCWTNYIK